VVEVVAEVVMLEDLQDLAVEVLVFQVALVVLELLTQAVEVVEQLILLLEDQAVRV
jgi:hypothetical protein